MGTKIVIWKQSTNDGILYYTGCYHNSGLRIVWTTNRANAFDFQDTDLANDAASELFPNDFKNGVVCVARALEN